MKNKAKLFVGIGILAIIGIFVYVKYATVDIYLIRHGQTDANAQDLMLGSTDVPLNKVGKQQAEKLANALGDKNIPIIYASPLSRTYTTASIIAKKTHSKIITDDRIKERSYGPVEGMPRKKYEQLRKTHRFKEVEDTSSLLQRVLDFLNSHMKFGTTELYVVSHSGIIRRIIEYSEHKDYKEKISNCSIYKFKYNFLTKKYSFVGYKTLDDL